MKLECPHCGDVFTYVPEEAYSVFNCRHCNLFVQQPALDQLPPEKWAEFQAEQKAAERKAKRRAEREANRERKRAQSTRIIEAELVDGASENTQEQHATRLFNIVFRVALRLFVLVSRDLSTRQYSLGKVLVSVAIIILLLQAFSTYFRPSDPFLNLNTCSKGDVGRLPRIKVSSVVTMGPGNQAVENVIIGSEYGKNYPLVMIANSIRHSAATEGSWFETGNELFEVTSASTIPLAGRIVSCCPRKGEHSVAQPLEAPSAQPLEAPSVREVIGRWWDEEWPEARCEHIIFRQRGRVFIETTFMDRKARGVVSPSSTASTELVERPGSDGRRFVEKGDGDFLQDYVIDKQGNLQFWDRAGFVYAAKKL